MALQTLVKVNSINNLSQARFCAGIGVELLGFDLCPTHPGFVPLQQFEELTGWLSGVKVVGEFFDSTPSLIMEKIKSHELHYLETTIPANLKQLHQLGIPQILRLTLTAQTQLDGLRRIMDQKAQFVKLFLIDGDLITSSLDLSELSQLGANHSLLLESGVTCQSVLDLLDQSPIAGIALSGGREIKPGYYDFDQMAEILESIEVDS